MMIENTSFANAEASFQHFLNERNATGKLLWVFREDVACHGKNVFIKPPVALKNTTIMEAYYEFGRKRGLGVCLNAFCLWEERPCCYIYLPEDETDGEYRMISRVHIKYSALENITAAQSVLSRLCWRIEKLRDSSRFDCDDIPSKYDIRKRLKL